MMSHAKDRALQTGIAISVAALHALGAALIFTHAFKDSGSLSVSGLAQALANWQWGCTVDLLICAFVASGTAAVAAIVYAATPIFCVARFQRTWLRRCNLAWYALIAHYALVKVIASPVGDASFWGLSILVFAASLLQGLTLDRCILRVYSWALGIVGDTLPQPPAKQPSAQEPTETGKESPTSSAASGPPAISRSRVVRLFSLSAPDWPWVLSGFVFLSAAAIGTTFLPNLTGNVIDSVAVGGDMTQFSRQVLLLVGAGLATAVCTGMRSWSFTIALARLRIRLRDRLFRSFLTQDIGFFDATATGDLTSRLSSDTTNVSDQLSLNVNVFLRSVISVVGCLVFMFILSWRLTALTFCTLPPIILISQSYGKFVARLSKRAQKRLAECNRIAEEGLAAMATVRTFGAERQEAARHSDVLADYYALQRAQADAQGLYAALTTALPSLVSALVLYIGGKLVQAGEMTGGVLISFVLYQFSLAASFATIGDIYGGLVSALGAADKLFTLLDRQPRMDWGGTHMEGVGAGEAVSVEAATTGTGTGNELRTLDAAHTGGAAAIASGSTAVSVTTGTQPGGDGTSPSDPGSAAEAVCGGGGARKETRSSPPSDSTPNEAFAGANIQQRMDGTGTGTGVALMSQQCLAPSVAPAQDVSTASSNASGDCSASTTSLSGRGRVDFQCVDFRYPTRPEKQVLKGFSLSLLPNTVTALVGASGGGKSSIVKLLQRLYEPNAGRILLDGRPLGSYDHEWLHSHISVVSQEPVLFARPIWECIAFGLRVATEEQEGGRRALLTLPPILRGHSEDLYKHVRPGVAPLPPSQAARARSTLRSSSTNSTSSSTASRHIPQAAFVSDVNTLDNAPQMISVAAARNAVAKQFRKLRREAIDALSLERRLKLASRAQGQAGRAASSGAGVHAGGQGSRYARLSLNADSGDSGRGGTGSDSGTSTGGGDVRIPLLASVHPTGAKDQRAHARATAAQKPHSTSTGSGRIITAEAALAALLPRSTWNHGVRVSERTPDARSKAKQAQTQLADQAKLMARLKRERRIKDWIRAHTGTGAARAKPAPSSTPAHWQSGTQAGPGTMPALASTLTAACLVDASIPAVERAALVDALADDQLIACWYGSASGSSSAASSSSASSTTVSASAKAALMQAQGSDASPVPRHYDDDDHDDDDSSSSLGSFEDDDDDDDDDNDEDSDDEDEIISQASGSGLLPTYSPTLPFMRHIVKSAVLANAHDFISRLPDGYETVLGNGLSGSLSGGQRQRTMIAASISRSSDVLILDEATSALDAESEKLVSEALTRAMAGRTVLVVAHRLSTVRDAHRIVTIEDGAIVESGTHDALMRRNGAYAKLVARQLVAASSSPSEAAADASSES